MEKKIMYTEYEPEKKFLWLHTKNGNMVLEAYKGNGWKPINNTPEKVNSNIVELPTIDEKCSKSQLISYIKILSKALVDYKIAKFEE